MSITKEIPVDPIAKEVQVDAIPVDTITNEVQVDATSDVQKLKIFERNLQ